VETAWEGKAPSPITVAGSACGFSPRRGFTIPSGNLQARIRGDADGRGYNLLRTTPGV